MALMTFYFCFQDLELGANNALKKVRSWQSTTILCLVFLTAKYMSCIIVWCPLYVLLVVADILARVLWLTIVYMFTKELETSVRDSATEKNWSEMVLRHKLLRINLLEAGESLELF